MKVCVSALAGDLDAPVDPRFARCRYFVIVELESMKFEAIPNTAAEAFGGAGIQAAQIVVSKGVDVVITGNIGPNAMRALLAAGVKVITGAYGTVRRAIEAYRRGELKETSTPTVSRHFGMGMGRRWGFR